MIGELSLKSPLSSLGVWSVLRIPAVQLCLTNQILIPECFEALNILFSFFKKFLIKGEKADENSTVRNLESRQ